MSCDKQNFDFTQPESNGTPNPRYFRPMVRCNAMVQDLPYGAVINPCWLPMEEISTATNQTISIVGDTITLSGNGGSIDLPATSPVTIGTAPIVTTDPVIPTSVVGADTYLLGEPNTWGTIVVNGVSYKIPLYA